MNDLHNSFYLFVCTVFTGDKVTGPIVSSTIQFVKPSVLKADLNKQFRERFDKWEPPRVCVD